MKTGVATGYAFAMHIRLLTCFADSKSVWTHADTLGMLEVMQHHRGVFQEVMINPACGRLVCVLEVSLLYGRSDASVRITLPCHKDDALLLETKVSMQNVIAAITRKTTNCANGGQYALLCAICVKKNGVKCCTSCLLSTTFLQH